LQEILAVPGRWARDFPAIIQEGGFSSMARDFKVRGCCCGIPFGCGVLVFGAGVAALWKFALPGLVALLGSWP
jgi:hypothetical protein